MLFVAQPSVLVAGRYSPFVGMDDPVGIKAVAETVEELVTAPLEIVPVVMFPREPVKEDVPVTVRLLPTVAFPLASRTMLLVDPDGWIALMTLIVLMAASY